MKTFHAEHGMTRLGIGIIICIVLFFCFFIVFLLRNEDPHWIGAYTQSVKKLHLIQNMSYYLLASAGAEKSAVMAETDEASQTFAEQSIQAALNVERTRRELEPLLKGNQEAKLFGEFSQCWSTLQQIDHEVLDLAVQNTNLKALRLSFGPAFDTIKHMEQALSQLMNVVSAYPDAVSLTRLASQAIVGTLNIYALHAPHIAESSMTRMELMEVDMQRLEAQITEALQRLQEQVEEPNKPLLDAAWISFKDFQRLTAEIVRLSRNNSNIRSFALSLGQKRNMTAACQAWLTALGETVQQGMAYKATR